MFHFFAAVDTLPLLQKGVETITEAMDWACQFAGIYLSTLGLFLIGIKVIK